MQNYGMLALSVHHASECVLMLEAVAAVISSGSAVLKSVLACLGGLAENLFIAFVD